MAKQPSNKRKAKGRASPESQRLWETKRFPIGAYKDNPHATK